MTLNKSTDPVRFGANDPDQGQQSPGQRPSGPDGQGGAPGPGQPRPRQKMTGWIMLMLVALMLWVSFGLMGPRAQQIETNVNIQLFLHQRSVR